jgi:hypothetical protein
VTALPNTGTQALTERSGGSFVPVVLMFATLVAGAAALWLVRGRNLTM